MAKCQVEHCKLQASMPGIYCGDHLAVWQRPVVPTPVPTKMTDAEALSCVATMSWYSAGKGYEYASAAYSHIKQRLEAHPE